MKIPPSTSSNADNEHNPDNQDEEIIFVLKIKKNSENQNSKCIRHIRLACVHVRWGKNVTDIDSIKKWCECAFETAGILCLAGEVCEVAENCE